jgi:hypothetical protein
VKIPQPKVRHRKFGIGCLSIVLVASCSNSKPRIGGSSDAGQAQRVTVTETTTKIVTVPASAVPVLTPTPSSSVVAEPATWGTVSYSARTTEGYALAADVTFATPQNPAADTASCASRGASWDASAAGSVSISVTVRDETPSGFHLPPNSGLTISTPIGILTGSTIGTLVSSCQSIGVRAGVSGRAVLAFPMFRTPAVPAGVIPAAVVLTFSVVTANDDSMGLGDSPNADYLPTCSATGRLQASIKSSSTPGPGPALKQCVVSFI